MTKSTSLVVTTMSALVIACIMAAFAAQPAAAQTAKKLKCSGCVKSKQIRNNGIKRVDIKNNAIDGSKVRNDSLTGADIQDGSITSDDLAAGTIVSAIFQNTVVVNANPLDPAGNCNNLRAALDGITDNSAANPYLIRLEPGVYDCRGNSAKPLIANNLDMKPFVDIEGSGQGITSILGDTDDDSEGVVGMVDNAELRHVTVDNLDTTDTGHALRIPNPVQGRVSNVTLDGGSGPNAREAIDCNGNTSNPGIVVLNSIVRALTQDASFGCNVVFVSTQIDASGAGTATCIAAYDGAFAPLNNACVP